MYLNLLFKAIKADTSAKRTAAFVKRLSQTLASHQPPFVCGALYLLGELFKLTPSLRNMLTEPEEVDDDVETFKDVPDSDGDAEERDASVAAAAVAQQGSSSSRYDGKKRDPQYANAQNSCLWEIAPLLSHFHPSVALHATQLLASAPITTTPDLELHTLSHFLDRFVYRNAKKINNANAGKESLMKPGAKGLDRSGMVLMRKDAAAKNVESRVNADEFRKKKTEDVSVDQLFFHTYFNMKAEDEKARGDKKDKKKKKRAGAGSDVDEDEDISDEDLVIDGLDEGNDDDEELELAEEASDMDEDEVWKAMQDSMPKAAGDSDIEDDDSELGEDSDVSAGEFAYSDSELGVDEAEDEAGEAAAEEEDDDDEVETAGRPSFFPSDDEDDDELAGFEEDDGDVIGSDEEIDIDLPMSKSSKTAGKDGESRKEKKRKLKHLPAFASADDWKDLIDADGDDD